MDAIRGTCFCLLYDLCAWMARALRPVPAGATEYVRDDLRSIPDPVDRLDRYVNPDLLAAWKRALAPFFGAGARLLPGLHDTGQVRLDGGQEAGPILAQVDFTNASSLLDHEGHTLQLPERGWVLSVWLSPDLRRVESASLRPA